MLQTILSLYLQGLFLATLLIIFLSLILFIARGRKRVGRTLQERQEFLFDLLMINIMTIPILAFGIIAIILIIKA